MNQTDSMLPPPTAPTVTSTLSVAPTLTATHAVPVLATPPSGAPTLPRAPESAPQMMTTPPLQAQTHLAPPATAHTPPVQISSQRATPADVVEDTKNAGVIPIVFSLVMFFAGAALNQPLLWPAGSIMFIVGLVVRSRARKGAVETLSTQDQEVAKASLQKSRIIVLLIVLAAAVRFAVVEIYGGR